MTMPYRGFWRDWRVTAVLVVAGMASALWWAVEFPRVTSWLMFICGFNLRTMLDELIASVEDEVEALEGKRR